MIKITISQERDNLVSMKFYKDKKRIEWGNMTLAEKEKALNMVSQTYNLFSKFL